MANLENTSVKNTYKGLLTLETATDGIGTSGTIQTIQSGDGQDTALGLSDQHVRIEGQMLFGSSSLPAEDTSENTALLVNGSNNVVRRELSDLAFSGSADIFKTISVSGQNDVVASESTDTLNIAGTSPIGVTTNASSKTVTVGVTGILSPPTAVMRSEGVGITSGDTYVTPTAKQVSNTSDNRSYLIDSLSELSIDNTAGKITVANGGVVRIDVNIIATITSSQTDVYIKVIKEDTDGGTDTIGGEIARVNTAQALTAIGFSLFDYDADAGNKYYYQIKTVSGNATLQSDSTFTVTKLTID